MYISKICVFSYPEYNYWAGHGRMLRCKQVADAPPVWWRVKVLGVHIVDTTHPLRVQGLTLGRTFFRGGRIFFVLETNNSGGVVISTVDFGIGGSWFKSKSSNLSNCIQVRNDILTSTKIFNINNFPSFLETTWKQRFPSGWDNVLASCVITIVKKRKKNPFGSFFETE